MHNGRDVMANFEPSEYTRKMIFQSVTQADQKKKSKFSQQELNLWPATKLQKTRGC